MPDPDGSASRGSSLTDSADLSPVELARRQKTAACVDRKSHPRQRGKRPGTSRKVKYRSRDGEYRQAPKQVADPLAASINRKQRCQLASLGLFKGKTSQALAVRHALKPLDSVAAARLDAQVEQHLEHEDSADEQSQSVPAHEDAADVLPTGAAAATTSTPRLQDRTAAAVQVPVQAHVGPPVNQGGNVGSSIAMHQPMTKQQHILQKLQKSLPPHLRTVGKVSIGIYDDMCPHCMLG